MDSYPRFFFFGFGYCAQYLVHRLAPCGAPWQGTTRSAEKAISIRTWGLIPHVWDGVERVPDEWLRDSEAILISTAPDDQGCPTLRAGKDAILANAKNIKWLGYLSSNGVYGDHDGAWVDENAKTEPTTKRGQNRLRAECQWQQFAQANNLALNIFRLPGIYGPSRNAFESLRKGKSRRIVKDGQVFNRMHVEDIAAALENSITSNAPAQIYNLNDDLPAPPQDVVAYAAQLLGQTPPPEMSLESADISEMGRSFYAENKRVSNTRMKEVLGVTLAYPTYRDGLRAIFEAEQSARDEGEPRRA